MKCLTSAEEEVKDPLPMIDASDERGGSIDSSDIIDWMRSPHPSNCTRICNIPFGIRIMTIAL